MRSLLQINASRANGARSKGPKTAEGKKRSSMNALRHGMFSDCLVLPDEDGAVFRALLHQFLDRFQPVDGAEHALVEEMVASQWRMRRGWATETRIISDAMDRQPPALIETTARLAGAYTDLSTASTLPLINRCEARFNRMFHRAIRTLFELRARRARAEAEPPKTENCETNPSPADS